MTTGASAARIAEASSIENLRTLRAQSHTKRRVLGEMVAMPAPSRAAIEVQKAEAKAHRDAEDPAEESLDEAPVGLVGFACGGRRRRQQRRLEQPVGLVGLGMGRGGDRLRKSADN